jgi:Ring finger domain
MCTADIVFYHVCGHTVQRITRCQNNSLCLSGLEDPDFDYFIVGVCHQCQLMTSQRIPEHHLVLLRHSFFRKYIRTQQRHRENEEERAIARLQDLIFNHNYADNKVELDVEALMRPVDLSTLANDSRSCNICKEPLEVVDAGGRLEHPVRLPCHSKHVFGHRCIRSWFSKHPSCPICRASFSNQQTQGQQPSLGQLPRFSNEEIMNMTDRVAQQETERDRDMKRRLQELASSLGFSPSIFENINAEDMRIGFSIDSTWPDSHGIWG